MNTSKDRGLFSYVESCCGKATAQPATIIVTTWNRVSKIHPMRAVNDNLCEHRNEKDASLTKQSGEDTQSH